MRYRLSVLCLCTAMALFLLDGCGGGSRLPLNSNRSGRAIFTMIWPQRGRLIPEVSNSIVVQINSGTTPVTSQLLVRPANGGPASVTFSPLPTGTLTATASAYPSTDGTGVAQA